MAMAPYTSCPTPKPKDFDWRCSGARLILSSENEYHKYPTGEMGMFFIGSQAILF
jgi:hypothetical protein